jgi:hypothetical protein
MKSNQGKWVKKKKRNNTLGAQNYKHSFHEGVKYGSSSHAILLE